MSREHYLDCFKYFVHVPIGCMRSWVDMLRGAGHRIVLIVRLVKSVEHVHLNVHYVIPRH